MDRPPRRQPSPVAVVNRRLNLSLSLSLLLGRARVSGLGFWVSKGDGRRRGGQEMEMSRELGEAVEPSEKSPPLFIDFFFLYFVTIIIILTQNIQNKLQYLVLISHNPYNDNNLVKTH